MGFAIIMWLAVVFLFTPTTLRRILCSVAQGPLNVPLISALRESLALNQSVRSLNLPQICLLVNLQCQIEFSWTATLPWQMWLCDPIPCTEVSECVSSNHVVKSQLPLAMNMDERSCQCRARLWEWLLLLLLLLVVGSGNASTMPFKRRQHSLTCLSLQHCVARLLSFWSNYTALTLSQIICAAEGETLSKVSAEISADEKARSSPAVQKQCGAFIFLRERGHPAETSSDDTYDNANVRGDESTVPVAGWQTSYVFTWAFDQH